MIVTYNLTHLHPFGRWWCWNSYWDWVWRLRSTLWTAPSHGRTAGFWTLFVHTGDEGSFSSPFINTVKNDWVCFPEIGNVKSKCSLGTLKLARCVWIVRICNNLLRSQLIRTIRHWNGLLTLPIYLLNKPLDWILVFLAWHKVSLKNQLDETIRILYFSRV